MPDLAFVLDPRQSHVAVELAEALAAAASEHGGTTDLVRDGFPLPGQDLVYVIVCPGEYFALRPGDLPKPLRDRTLMVRAEVPGSRAWRNAGDAATAAMLAFDVSAKGVEDLRRRGSAAEPLLPGRSPLWEPEAGVDRTVDVCFAGPVSERRAHVLARQAPWLASRRVEIALWDPWRMPYGTGTARLAAEPRPRRLARARVALEIHDSEPGRWDPLLAVQAAQAGAILLTEPVTGSEPWQPGTHFAAAPEPGLGSAAAGLLDGGRDDGLREAARALVEELPPLTERVGLLLEAVADVAGRRWVPGPRDAVPSARFFAVPDRDAAGPPPPLAMTDDPAEAERRRQLKTERLEEIRARRERAAGSVQPATEELHRSGAYDAARPRVSALVSLFDYPDHVGDALDSVAASTFADLEVVVVDDGSTDDSATRARAHLVAHDDLPALLLAHGVNRGLPAARNTALDAARGELAFVLDADNVVYPRAIELLVAALDADPAAAFAYGPIERFADDGPLDLRSVGPWDPQCLRTMNFIDAMALVRTELLREVGGFTADLRLHGWEDYDLWCSVAELGRHGIAVPAIIGRYRVDPDSMLRSVTELSHTEAFRALQERHPRLLAGLEPPL